MTEKRITKSGLVLEVDNTELDNFLAMEAQAEQARSSLRAFIAKPNADITLADVRANAKIQNRAILVLMRLQLRQYDGTD